MNDQRKETVSNSEVTESRTTGGVSIGVAADKVSALSRRNLGSEREIFRCVLEELTPKEDRKIRSEIRAIKASRKRLATLLKQGVTPEALYDSARAKGFTISREEFMKIIRTITNPRPRVSRIKTA